MAVVGVLGFIGLIGPTSEQSIFGGAWYFDNAENWAHLMLGVVSVAAAYVLSVKYQKILVMVLGVVGVLIGLYSLVGYNMLLGANLENPLDSILHLAVGGWALWAALRKEGGSMMSGSAM